MERVDVVRQTDAINANLNCNSVMVRRGCFGSDRAGDTGRVSIFHRIGDELANDEPERHSLFRRKNGGYWKDAVDRGLLIRRQGRDKPLRDVLKIPISPSNNRSQLLSTRISWRRTSPKASVPSIAIFQFTAALVATAASSIKEGGDGPSMANNS